MVAPVQRVTDFLSDEVSTGQLPTSSYRSGLSHGKVIIPDNIVCAALDNSNNAGCLHRLYLPR